MRRVLIIAYDFSPCSAPGAALRTDKLAQYLPEFGWEPVVICRDEGNDFAGAREPSGAKRRIVRVRTPVPPRISYQVGAWTWARRIIGAARSLIPEIRPDVCYASCPPFPHSLTALRVARDAGIPAVVDFRDAWSLDPHLGKGALRRSAKSLLCRRFYPPLERRIVRSAAAIIMNTPSMEQAYAPHFAAARGRIHVVPNGYDEADFRDAVEKPSRPRPRLLYCGRFSGVGARSPELLLRAIRTVVDSGRPVEGEILGDDSPNVREGIRRLGLENVVQCRGTVPHREAIRAMREADVLLLHQTPSRNQVTPIAGKTFEYIRSGRPILAVVPPGDNADLVRRYAAVSEIVTDGDAARAGAAILRLLDCAGKAPATVPREFVEKYSRRRIAAQIAAIFDAAAGATRGLAASQQTLQER